ncbi:MAG: hypothetical protein ACXWUG_12875 [Polyangiales bacterium]
MTPKSYRIDVDRVVVTGAGASSIAPTELRALVEAAVVRELTNAALPNGRAVRTSVRVDTPSSTMGDGGGLAGVIAGGVVRAVKSGPSRG